MEPAAWGGKTIKEIAIGDKAQFSKTVTESDVYLYAGLSGDMNPVHIDMEYAKNTLFGQRIAHGVLSIGFISNVLGTKLPGPGVIYLQQECRFLKPVFIGDTITAIVEVIEKDEGKNRVKLKTLCINQKGQVVIEGESLVMPRKEGGGKESVIQLQKYSMQPPRQHNDSCNKSAEGS
jgi:3-hydroxybutyryl-CoA dehydratase